MDSLPIAPTVGKRTRAGIPACLLFTSVTERNKHAKPNTVTNRMATYRVRAGSIVEPCGRVFHRVEQSPESKECQHLQSALAGPARSQGICRHCPRVMPWALLATNVANRQRPTRPTRCQIKLALSPHSFPVGQQGKPLPSSSLCSLCGVQSCRTDPWEATGRTGEGAAGPHGERRSSRTFGAALEEGRMLDEEQDQANYVHQEAQHRPGRLRILGVFDQGSLLSFMRKEPLSGHNGLASGHHLDIT